MKDKTKDKQECFEEIIYYKYADDELETQERKKVEDHLEGCSSCRQFIAAIEAENAVLKEYFSGGSLSPNLTPFLRKRLDKKGTRFSLRYLAYAATFLLAVLLSLILIIDKPDRGKQDAHHVMVQSARVEGQAAQPHIFASKNPDVTFIWLEKFETGKGETEGNNETII